MNTMGVPMEPAQIANYVTTNRHNHVTAYYYLLKNKTDKNPALLEASNPSSPLIYKPELKKEFYIPKKAQQAKDSKINDSFNASTIVSSLVEANKSKLMANTSAKKEKKADTFDKAEEFKLFPKPKTSSTYGSSPPISIEIGSNSQINKPGPSLTARNEH